MSTEDEVSAAARAICENWGCHGLPDGSDCDGSIHVSDARAALQAVQELNSRPATGVGIQNDSRPVGSIRATVGGTGQTGSSRSGAERLESHSTTDAASGSRVEPSAATMRESEASAEVPIDWNGVARITDGTLARMIKSPTVFAAWVLRDTLTELQQRRATVREHDDRDELTRGVIEAGRAWKVAEEELAASLDERNRAAAQEHIHHQTYGELVLRVIHAQDALWLAENSLRAAVAALDGSGT